MGTRRRTLGRRNIIGKRITKAREEKGLLQKDLAAKLQVEGIDISVDALSQIEGQRRSVVDYELFTIAKILGKDVNWFFEDGE